MKIEKINENEIKVTFNILDLQKNNIDMHAFMSNSIESQELFLNILDEAEQKIGFITDNYKLSINALAFTNGTFIVTVTRLGKELSKPYKVKANKKISKNPQKTTFKFLHIDDFLIFQNFIKSLSFEKKEIIQKNISLYNFKNSIFLILNANTSISQYSNIISEFAKEISHSNLMANKIEENAILIK